MQIDIWPMDERPPVSPLTLLVLDKLVFALLLAVAGFVFNRSIEQWKVDLIERRQRVDLVLGAVNATGALEFFSYRLCDARAQAGNENKPVPGAQDMTVSGISLLSTADQSLTNVTPWVKPAVIRILNEMIVLATSPQALNSCSDAGKHAAFRHDFCLLKAQVEDYARSIAEYHEWDERQARVSATATCGKL